MLSLPEEPISFNAALKRLSEWGSSRRLAFYLADEPEIHGVSSFRIEAMYQEIRTRFPMSVVTMAIVRPQAVSEFSHAADFFLVDPYPVPSMPMIWLSDAIDTAKAAVGSSRVGAVVQAFGGVEHAVYGWPRMPSLQEMTCLTYLSLIHGAKAVFFYSWKEAIRTKQGRMDLTAVIERLSRLRSWFSHEPVFPQPLVRMISPYGYDPSGRPAVQAAWWRSKEGILLIVLNTIGAHVSAEVALPEIAAQSGIVFREEDGNRGFGVKQGRMEIPFKPYEVFVLSASHP